MEVCSYHHYRLLGHQAVHLHSHPLASTGLPRPALPHPSSSRPLSRPSTMLASSVTSFTYERTLPLPLYSVLPLRRPIKCCGLCCSLYRPILLPTSIASYLCCPAFSPRCSAQSTTASCVLCKVSCCILITGSPDYTCCSMPFVSCRALPSLPWSTLLIISDDLWSYCHFNEILLSEAQHSIYSLF